MTVLVTGATGMFGSRVTAQLASRGVDVLALTRSESSAAGLTAGTVRGVVGDMDSIDTLAAHLAEADRVFVVSPMTPDIATREIAVIQAAAAAGAAQIVKLYGSVDHQDDPLDLQHQASIASLRECGSLWALLSPQTVMETNLLTQREAICEEDCLMTTAEDGEIGIVSADNCAEAAAVVLTSDPTEHNGRNWQITGPEALTYDDIAATMTRVLGRTIRHDRISEETFSALLLEVGMPVERHDFEVLCHYRHMREGRATLVTDDFQTLTGREPMTLEQWVRDNADKFATAPQAAQSSDA